MSSIFHLQLLFHVIDFRVRYSDIMVHRLLTAAIDADVTHPDMLNARRVQVGVHEVRVDGAVSGPQLNEGKLVEVVSCVLLGLEIMMQGLVSLTPTK